MWDCRLIVVAVPDPRDEAFTADIAVQVAVVKGWWADEELGERRYEVAEAGELSALRDLEDFLREQEVVSAHRRQVLVVYITGHGVNPGSDEHYLLMPETDSGKLLNTAFQTSELITSVLESDVEHALVMVDSCRSGVLRVELPRLVRALSEERRSLTSRVVLTVGGENDRPRPKAFSNLLAAMAVYLREESSGYASSHLSFQDFHALMGELQQHSAAPDIHLVWPEHKVSRANSQHFPTPCLPNPGYRPTPDLTAVSGIPPHFTGRTAERDRITEFLRSGTTALVVTGVTGSGKTALLNWTATQGIDAAVLARDAEPDQLARALAGVPESDGDALDRLLDHIHDSVRREHRPLTVLIDGIDEAKNPTSVVTNLIGPLAQQRTDDGRPAVRMVLGVRSPRPDGPGAGRQPGLLDLLVTVTSAGPPLRTDDTAAVQADIEHYVRARLPGASDLARTIAERVAPSFLDARIAVDDLLSHGEPADAAWLDTLGQGTGELLRQEIRTEAARGGFPAEHIGYALSATAFAQGAGLPWADVWRCAIEALAGQEVPRVDALIRWLSNSRLMGYLTTGMEDGRTVYRPAHEHLAEVLRENEALRENPDASQQALARALVALCTAQGDRPHPYLLRHLVHHAKAGGILNDRVITEEFLVQETSGTVRGTLGLLGERTSDTARLYAWASIEPFLADASPRFRRDSLHFALPHQDGWKLLTAPDNILARTDTNLLSLTSFTSLIAAGTAAGTVHLWDPTTLTPLGRPVKGPAPNARALVAVGSRLAIGCDDGVWTCDPLSGRTERLPIGASVRCMVAYGDAGLAVGTDEGLVLYDGAGLREVQGGPVEGVAALGPVLAWYDGTFVHIDDGVSRERVEADVTALALFEDGEGRPVLALATPEAIEFRDVSARTPHRYRRIRRSAEALALCRDGLLAGAEGGVVRLWNPATGEETRRFSDGHTGSVTSLAVVTASDGTPVLASGSLDRTVRVWNAGMEQRQLTADGTLLAVLRDGLVSVGPERNLLVRSFGDGAVVRSIELPRRGETEVTALAACGAGRIVVGLSDGAVVRWDGRGWHMTGALTSPGACATALAVRDGVLAVGTSEGGVQYCDMTRDQFMRQQAVAGAVRALEFVGESLAVACERGVELHPLAGGPADKWPGWEGPAESLAAAGDEVLVAGGADGSVRVWEPGEGERVLSVRHDGPVSGVAVAGSLIVSTGRLDTTVRMWDLESGEEVRRIVTGVSLTEVCVVESLVVFGGPRGIAAVTRGGSGEPGFLR